MALIQTSINGLAPAAHTPATAAGAARYSTEIVADQIRCSGGVVEGRHERDNAVAFVNEQVGDPIELPAHWALSKFAFGGRRHRSAGAVFHR
ncbi:hypothetical protein [Burkholderia ubonensis]|uniref:hypothetical protein n=1 Tax=Burkholderia ubonensis TaxID=101571 RepID=UPI000A5E646E|nr:hypothetical protein [Burkholderia ubonensis]